MPITSNATHQEMESKLSLPAKDGGFAAETIFTWEGDGIEDVHKNFTNIMTEYFDENYPSVTKMKENEVCNKADEI